MKSFNLRALEIHRNFEFSEKCPCWSKIAKQNCVGELEYLQFRNLL